MLVQLDLDYRKEWDSMSVDLEICDSEPLTHSDLIYWELSWPVIIIMFQNNIDIFIVFYLLNFINKPLEVITIFLKLYQNKNLKIK